MDRIPVILNVDTGIDDALAIAVASASDVIEILAITTSFGNNSVDKTTENTLRITELIGLDAPVAAGAEKPLLSQANVKVFGSAAQGYDGLGGKSGLLPYPVSGAADLSCIELMAKKISECSRKVVIVSTCALTNIAVLLLSYPDIKNRIDGIAFSGGAVYTGNVLPTVEANLLADPEAAQIVLKSGIRMLLCGMDASNEAYVTFEDRERLRLANTRPSAFFYEALKGYSDHYENLLLKEGSPLYDVVPVAWLIDPKLVKTKPYYVEIDLNGYYTRGATVADVQRIWNKAPNAAVAVEVDRERICDLVIDSLRKLR